MLIVPTYNERESVANLVARVRTAVGPEPIFFADDVSPDGTAEEIRRLRQSDDNVHLMVREGRRGYGSACRELMKKVLSEGLADHLIQFDCDLSHPPEMLPTMLEMLRTCPVVVGSRYIPGGGSRNWDARRRMLSRGGNLYARMLTGVPVHDMTSGFVGYRAEALRRIDLDQIHSEGYAFLMEMKFSLHRQGIAFGEFPIIFSEREAGKSKFSRKIMMEGVRFPVKALRRRFSFEPGRRTELTNRPL
jgi:dolichol-phosphate mannosyltransferase